MKSNRLGPALACAALTGALLFSAAFAGKTDTSASPADRPLPAAVPAPRAPAPAEGELIGRMSVPRLAMDSPVFEGIGVSTLARGAGHVPGTALPGEDGGPSLIAVPRGQSGAAVSALKLNDRVRFRTSGSVLGYRVVERRILEPALLDAGFAPAGRLTLVTAYPADSAGPAPMRLAVLLEPVRD